MARGLSGLVALMVLALGVSPSPALAGARHGHHGPADLDSRTGRTKELTPHRLAAREALRRSLGPEGVVATDPISGGVRLVARTDGLLTGPSSRSPEAVVLAYVRAHEDLFGLGEADIASLRLTLRSRTASGLTTLEWTQTVGGVPAYDSALGATVTRDGRIVAIHGSAVPGLDGGGTPVIDAARARRIAAADVGGDPADAQASRTILGSAKGGQAAWRVLAWDADRENLFDVVVDAQNGDVLVRHDLTEEYSGATVFYRHPGSAVDPTGHVVDLAADPSWLSAMNTTSPASLRGNNAHAYADRGANGFDAGEDIAPSSGSDWNFPMATFNAGLGCPLFGSVPGCTWDGSSEVANRAQATTQLFWFVNTFHDHLAASPIGFTHASRNFELADADGAGPGLGNDAVNAEADDAGGLNNAFMTTPPDGSAPRLQLYLFTSPYLNSADVADVTYHELTHGLSNRLIGNGSGLTTHQAQALGEGWSDWYAFDYLAAQGQVGDTAADGELLNGAYLEPGGTIAGGPPGVRTQALDCSVGSSAPTCPGTKAAGPGGYTLGDLGRISGTDVHADGEIWVETLWDIRKALGSAAAERLVTDAMRLSPINPSFLDERDAILAADQALGATHYEALWQIFAARGMGWSASVPGSSATSAAEAFDLPPLVAHAGVAVDDAAPLGDGDGIAEPGEAVRLTETLRNPKPFALTTVGGLLGGGAGLVVGTPWARWADPLAPAASSAATSPYAITIPADQVCGAQLGLTLDVTTDQGAQSIPLPLATGGPGPLASPNSADVSKAIPDNDPAGVTSSLPIAAPGLINTIRVRIPAITHPYDGDLVITLIAPDGTTVLLADRRGGSANNFTGTVFDDAAATDISGGTAPFTGGFRPEQPLARLRGKPMAGTWSLKIVDTAALDSGSLGAWGLDQRPAVCSTSAPAPPAATTGAASSISATSATLSGGADPKGTATEGAFQIGTSTAYGTLTGPATIGSGTGSVTHSRVLTALTPSTTYHFRAVALRAGTPVAVGEDRTFTTAAAPAGGGATSAGKPGSTVDGTSSGRGTVRFRRSPKRLTATRARTFAFTFEATHGHAGRATFASDRALSAGVRAHVRLRVMLGRGSFSAKRKTDRLVLKVKIARKAWRALTRMRKIRTRVTVVLDGRSYVWRFVLQAPKRKPARR